jgi:hypothetical protein
MKNKDTENKGGKKTDEVKNKDLMMLVNELKMLDFKNDSSFISFSSREEKELTKNEMIQKYNEGKFSSYILDRFRTKVYAERDSLIQEVTTYYTSKLDYTEKGSAMSPKEIVQTVEQHKIRVKRLSMVFEPDYYQTITKKSNGDEYDLVKLNYIGDDGLKFIMISKTFGLKGNLGLEFSMRKVARSFLMIEAEQGTKDVHRLETSASYKRDNVIVSVDGKIWNFYFLLNDKNDFIKTSLRLELWKYYHQNYLRSSMKRVNFDEINFDE